MEAIFWTCLGLVIYAYAGYPALLWAVSRLRPRTSAPEREPAVLPRVSLLLPAHNEERVMAERLENLLALDYPPDRREILVGLDGSTDATPAIVASYLARGVRLAAAGPRRGKTALLNEMIGQARGEILAYTDANCAWDRDALRWLVAPFADPGIGCVIGELSYTNVDDPTVAGGEGLYWRLENAIKEMESRLGGTLVANGSIYAMRRDLFQPLPAEISDDSVNPLRVLASGFRVVFQRRAVAREKAASRLGEEFRRKARMVTRQLGSHAHVRAFLWPPRPALAFRLLSHKLLRWLVPLFLAVALAANLLLLDHPLYWLTLAVALTGCAAGAAGALSLARGRPLGRIPRLLVYFFMVNAAAAKGLFDFVTGRRRAVWRVSASTR